MPYPPLSRALCTITAVKRQARVCRNKSVYHKETAESIRWRISPLFPSSIFSCYILSLQSRNFLYTFCKYFMKTRCAQSWTRMFVFLACADVWPRCSYTAGFVQPTWKSLNLKTNFSELEISWIYICFKISKYFSLKAAMILLYFMSLQFCHKSWNLNSSTPFFTLGFSKKHCHWPWKWTFIKRLPNIFDFLLWG